MSKASQRIYLDPIDELNSLQLQFQRSVFLSHLCKEYRRRVSSWICL